MREKEVSLLLHSSLVIMVGREGNYVAGYRYGSTIRTRRRWELTRSVAAWNEPIN